LSGAAFREREENRILRIIRTYLKNRILVQDSVFAERLRRDTRGGAEFSSVAGFPV
jgi:hypothetical protein